LPFHAIKRQPHPHTGRKPEKSQLAHIHTENRKHESKAFFSISIARPKTVLVIDFERYTEKSSGRDAKRAGFGGFFPSDVRLPLPPHTVSIGRKKGVS
jgi:hypothetical protein